MQARSENNRPEMSRLKAEAMALMNQASSKRTPEATQNREALKTSQITQNEDGDQLIILSKIGASTSK
ncbi:MAG: hypothetical protein KGZ48_07870 [Dethiobacter sp.]|nr:hypothetical protein [Dethiobacter sp.]